MELWIPSQNLEIRKIHLCDFVNEDKYTIAPIQYHDGNLVLTNFVIMTPPLIVTHYDIETGKLQFDLTNYIQFASKINTFQAYMVSMLSLHQKALFGIAAEYTHDIIESMIQYIAYKNKLTLYTGSHKLIRLFEENPGGEKMQHAANPILKVGDRIKCAIHIKGISCIWNFNTGLPRLRFQHVLKAAYRV